MKDINAKWECECGHRFWSNKPGCKIQCPKCKSKNVKLVKSKGKYLP